MKTMNLKNKYLFNTIRILFGLFMIFSGVSGLMMGPNAEGIPEPMIVTSQVLWSTGIFQFIKVTEIISGIMLVINFLPALAAIFLAPIALGVIIFNAMTAPEFIISGIIFAIIEAYLGYVYWDKYKALFKMKT